MTSLETLDTASTAVRTRRWAIVASAALGWAVFLLIVMHAVSAYDPLHDPLSRYAFADTGGGLLEASLITVAITVVAVRSALRAAGLARARTTTVLTVTTVVGLLAATMFPATFTADIDPTSGKIHQYASVLAFVSLPGIGFSLLERLREIPALAATRAMLKRLLLVCVAALALFAASYVVDSLPPTSQLLTFAEVVPVGFAQRLVLVSDLVLLVALLVVATRAAQSRATVRSDQTAEPEGARHEPECARGHAGAHGYRTRRAGAGAGDR